MDPYSEASRRLPPMANLPNPDAFKELTFDPNVITVLNRLSVFNFYGQNLDAVLWSYFFADLSNDDDMRLRIRDYLEKRYKFTRTPDENFPEMLEQVRSYGKNAMRSFFNKAVSKLNSMSYKNINTDDLERLFFNEIEARVSEAMEKRKISRENTSACEFIQSIVDGPASTRAFDALRVKVGSTLLSKCTTLIFVMLGLLVLQYPNDMDRHELWVRNFVNIDLIADKESRNATRERSQLDRGRPVLQLVPKDRLPLFYSEQNLLEEFASLNRNEIAYDGSTVPPRFNLRAKARWTTLESMPSDSGTNWRRIGIEYLSRTTGKQEEYFSRDPRTTYNPLEGGKARLRALTHLLVKGA